METTMTTIDLKKTWKPYYRASAQPSLITVPRMSCLMVDGTGDPDSQGFQEAVGSLYSVAYTLKFTFKKERAIDYPVMALEGLWSAEDFTAFTTGERKDWQWTVLIAVPDCVTKKDAAHALDAAKKKAKFPRFPEVRLEKLAEGLCAQVMHVGPYATERATVELLHGFVEEQGYALRGRHHEIYLGDPRRAAPEKMKTILRQPVGR
jgi:hypothetical protein